MKEPLKVIVVNPPTEEQKNEMLKRIENYFNQRGGELDA